MFPIAKTRVIPTINGGHGLIPVSIPAINGALFIYFLILQSAFSLSDSMNPLIPHIIRRAAINILETNSIILIKSNCIPITEKIIPTKIYATNLPDKKNSKSLVGVILLILLDVKPRNTGIQKTAHDIPVASPSVKPSAK